MKLHWHKYKAVPGSGLNLGSGAGIGGMLITLECTVCGKRKAAEA